MGFVGSATGLGSISAALATAAAALKSEYDAYIERLARINRTNVSVGEAMRNMQINFAGDDTISREQLAGVALDISKDTGSDMQVVAAALSDAFSAKGDATNATAAEAVRQSLRLMPNQADAAATMSARALDISKLTGETDMSAILGTLVNLQQSARVTNLDQLGRTSVPAMGAMVASGDTLEQAAELFATLTQLTADARGDTSATGQINLVKQLQEFVPSLEGSDKRGDFAVSAEAIAKFEAAASTTERIAVMQENADLRRQFVGGASFEAKNYAAMMDLLSGGATSRGLLGQAQQNVVPLSEAGAIFEAKVRELDDASFAASPAAERRRNVLDQTRDLTDPDGARTARIRADLDAALQAVDLPGVDALARRFQMQNFDAGSAVFGRDPADKAARQIADILQDPLTGSAKSLTAVDAERLIATMTDLVSEIRDEGQRREAGARAAAARIAHEERRP
jgi:hypothetical protein